MTTPAALIHAKWEEFKERRRLTVSLIDDEPIVELDVLDESWLETDSPGRAGTNERNTDDR